MYVHVTVKAGAKKEIVAQKDDTHFVVTVREPRTRNLANKRVREIIASVYTVSVSNVQIVSGHRSSSKIINVDTKKDI